MSKDLQGNSNLTVGFAYFRIFNPVNDQVFNTATPAFEAYNSSDITSYAINATQDGSSGRWYANAPTGLPASVVNYTYTLYQRVGGAAAESDPIISDGGLLDWSGSAVVPPTIGSIIGDLEGRVLGNSSTPFVGAGVEALTDSGLVIASENDTNALDTAILAVPGAVWSSGSRTLTAPVDIDMTQSIPLTNTPNTVGDALHASRVQGFGRWVLDLVGKTLTLYEADGTTVAKVFNLTLDGSGNPVARA